MVGAVQGLIGTFKTAAAPPANKKCSSVQIANLCCDSAYCGQYGSGATCSPAAGTYDLNC